MSADKDNEYLSDGITEEILHALAKVPGLGVPARTSSFVFKDRKEDVRKIGELLNVGTVLEGSVRKAGNQLRITAQLINVADGFHLWSETYDRNLTNIFAIQDDIARTIVAKLKLALAGLAGVPSVKRHTGNVEAYELYLKGKFHTDKLGRVGRKADAQKVLDQLLAQAKEKYVPAHAIAVVYDGLGDIEQANVWMNKAIEARKGRIVFLKVSSADELTRASPYHSEWLKKIGLDK